MWGNGFIIVQDAELNHANEKECPAWWNSIKKKIN